MEHLHTLFVAALGQMHALMRQDTVAGKKWTYSNVTSKKEKDFVTARAKGNRRINCVDGVQWAALLTGGIPRSALNWYMNKGKIVWLSNDAKAECLKYFDIIKVKTKTVKQLYKNGELCEGDILGYMTMTHTNAYYGGGKSFDTGGTEGKQLKKFIFSKLKWSTAKVSYILRLKDRYHYRVQAGAYSNYNMYKQQENLLKRKGFPCTLKQEDNMYKAQVGYFGSLENANRLVAKLNAAGIPAFAKQE